MTTADKTNPLNDGWNGTPFGGPDPQGTNFGRCGGQGAAGTNCAVTSGPHSGIGQALAMGDHDLRNLTSVSEIYFRYYMRPLAGYQFGQEKALTFNRCCAGVGGIYFGTMFWGISNPTPIGYPVFYAVNQGVNLVQNQGQEAGPQAPNWYYVEVHLRLNTPGVNDGVLEVWMDNCGTNGRGCTSAGTLRLRYTNVLFRVAGDSSLIGSIWLENWANPASSGEMYYDQLVVATRRVGPMPVAGSATPPSAPTGLTVR